MPMKKKPAKKKMPRPALVFPPPIPDTPENIRTDAIRHRIGDYEFRESDYQQMLIWAKATDLQPEEFLGGMSLIVSDGAIVSLEWHNLEVGVELDLSRVPKLEELFCGENYLTELDLSRVPYLRRLGCEGNDLTKLDLSQMPYLEEAAYEDNDLTELVLPDPETPEPKVE